MLSILPNYAESFIFGLAFAKDIALEKLGIAHSLYNRPKVVHTTLRDIPTDGGLKTDRKHSPRQFEVGDKVMIWDPAIKIRNTKNLLKYEIQKTY
eukprot:gene14573-31018_t